jgi:hypothetical protein
LTVGGPVQVSSLRRVAGRLEIRVFNPSAAVATVDLPGHSGSLIDLRGRVTGRWDGAFPLGAWAIATARLDAVSLD